MKYLSDEREQSNTPTLPVVTRTQLQARAKLEKVASAASGVELLLSEAKLQTKMEVRPLRLQSSRALDARL